MNSKKDKKLLKYKTKNEMLPAFFSGIFFSAGIEILTDDAPSLFSFENLSMILMFISCSLFFWEASKIHKLQKWFDSLPDSDRTDEKFLEDAEEWDMQICEKLGWGEDAYKKILPLISFFARVIGVISLLLYLFFVRLEII